MKKKEEENRLKLLKKNQKYKEISDKQRRKQEMDQLRAKLHHSNIERTLANSAVIESQKKKVRVRLG